MLVPAVNSFRKPGLALCLKSERPEGMAAIAAVFGGVWINAGLMPL